MKKLLRASFLLTLLMFCFFLVGKDQFVYANFSNASEVKLNQVQKGKLKDYSSQDFYKFTLPSDGNITLAMKRVHNASWSAAILNSKGELLDDFDTDYNEFATGNETTEVGLAKGTYYIKIEDYYGSIDVPYEFKVNFASSTNYEKEFNNNLSLANLINLNQTYRGVLQTRSDLDFYKVNVPNDGNVTLSMKRKHGTSWNATIFDSQGKVFNEFTTDASEFVEGDEKVEVGLPKGTYYIKIQDSYNGKNVSYEFKVGFAASANYEKEFNNNLTSANSININQTYKGMLQTSSDLDFYKLILPNDGQVSLSMKQQYDSRWTVTILNSEGQVFNQFITDGSELVEGYETMKVGLAKGTYYIKIEDYYDSSDVPYEFKAAFTSGNNFEKEFNNTIATANTINLNQTYTGMLQTSSDYDIYKFTVPVDGNITLSTTKMEDVSWRASIQNASKHIYKSLSTSYATVNGLESTALYLKKGTYYFVLEDNYDANDVPYNFTLSMKSSPLKVTQVKAANNKGKNDTITVTGINKNDTIKIYNASSKGTLLASTKATTTSANLSVKQLGTKAGKVYVSITRSGMGESDRVAVSYSGEQSDSLKTNQVKVTNNKGKADTMTVTGISKSDAIKVYNTSSKSKVLATKQATTSSVSLSINQLGTKAGKTYVTITRSGMTESVPVAISFNGEQSDLLKASQIKVTNNKGKADVVTVTGIAKGDTIKIYNASSRGTLLVSKQAAGSSVSLSVKQLGTKAGKTYVSITRSEMTESGRIAVNYGAEK
ncbi:pre-peptidase C-terminal domain-containing protein [Bacillus sp. CBEL-1]|uniref:pre-peptidase C-terminal domain-containing protein n=1 Tax=Bacillus sp. CBEL-1 TaxID=2502980 RepID=UPI00104C25FF|nr:pre-peptidase C-terminal domain-containing protein [Bacillus sp. CBEL-1]TDB55439.1 hypothetical protein EPL02_04310 [Bacillus sp. CBEL-1]